MTRANLILFVLLASALGGCTFIAFNKAPVTTTQTDSHNAKGTNVHTFDTTISPR